jgi:hypothetical protein
MDIVLIDSDAIPDSLFNRKPFFTSEKVKETIRKKGIILISYADVK